MPQPKTVLVVDDEMDMRIFIGALLETNGYRPVRCKDGEEGIRKAREHVPDLVILDVMMPGDGGVTMYRRLRTDASLCSVPVLMLTGVQEHSFSHYLKMLRSRIEGDIPEPDAYMEKPPDPDHLLEKVRSLLPDR